MTKLKQEDIQWIETQLSRVTSEAGLIAPRPEFIERAKAELMDLSVPQHRQLRQYTLWSALILVVSAIFSTAWFLGRRRHR